MPGYTIDIRHVANLLAGARHHGLDVENLLSQVGIAGQLLDAPRARVSQQQHGRLIRLLTRRMRDEMWGLCRTPVRRGTFACACRVAVRCRTIGDALASVLDLYRSHLGDFVPRLAIGDGTARIVVHDASVPDTMTATAEVVFLYFLLGTASWVAGRQVRLLEARFRHSPLAPRPERLWHAPVRFNQPRTVLSLPGVTLKWPIVRQTGDLTAFIRSAPERLVVGYQDTTSLSDRVRNLLRGRSPINAMTLCEAASAVAMSPSTFCRHLRFEGVSFQDIKDELRRDAAVELLANGSIGLAQVAENLGFSETSTFYRAFKQWTGVAPGAYRADLLPEAGRRLTGSANVLHRSANARRGPAAQNLFQAP